MLSYESFISVIFRWLDLAVIVAGSIYGIKQWVIPFLKKEKEREQEQWKDLEHKVTTHTSQAHLLDQQIAQDKLHAARLEQKVLLWQAMQDQEKRAQEHVREQFLERLHEQHDFKNKYIAQRSDQKNSAQEALDQAELTVREKFKDLVVAQRALHKAVIQLKERVT